jgi:hypothetical protein
MPNRKMCLMRSFVKIIITSTKRNVDISFSKKQTKTI